MNLRRGKQLPGARVVYLPFVEAVRSVHPPAGVPVHRVVPDEPDRFPVRESSDDPPGQGAPEPEPGPVGPRKHPAVRRPVAGSKRPEGTEDTRDGSPPGRQEGGRQERLEPDRRGTGELSGEGREQRGGLGW